MTSALWRMSPARAPASSPDPKNRSARRPDDRRAGVECNHRPREGFWRRAAPGDCGADEKRRSIRPKATIDGDRAQRLQRPACAANRTLAGVARRLGAEENVGLVFLHQSLSRRTPQNAACAQIALQPRQRHFVCGDRAAIDRKPADGGVGPPIATVVDQARLRAVGQHHAPRALHLDVKHLDGVAQPDDGVAAAALDFRARRIRRPRSKIGGTGQDRRGEVRGGAERARHDRLIIAGEETACFRTDAPSVKVADKEGSRLRIVLHVEPARGFGAFRQARACGLGRA